MMSRLGSFIVMHAALYWWTSQSASGPLLCCIRFLYQSKSCPFINEVCMWKSILQVCLHFPINIITASCGVLGPCITLTKPTHVCIENAFNLDWVYESRWRHSKYYQYQPEGNFTSQKVTCVRSSAIIVNDHEMPCVEGHAGRLMTTTRKPALPGRALTKLWNARWTVAGR